MTEIKEFRLSTLIRRRAESGRGYEKLARDIEAANAGYPDRKVDRRKLKKLAEDPENSVLSMRELRALDAFFSPLGEGLGDKPIFEKQRILESMSEVGEVTFMLGSTPRQDQRNDLSRWDARSMACLLHDLGRCGAPLRYEINDVLRTSPVNVRKLNSQDWHQVIHKEDGPSLISIGSPRACQATEIILAEMFNVAPFEKPTMHTERLPFHFVWSPDVANNFASSFTISGEDLKSLDLRLAKEVMSNTAWAFKLGSEKPFRYPRKSQEWPNMYGVIVAQRRKGGQVWLVVAGISGPTTHAAAQMVKSITHALPRADKRGEHGPPLWVAVAADVKMVPGRKQGDNRVISNVSLVGDPKIWDPDQ